MITHILTRIAATPNLTELRKLHIAGGLAPEVDAALRRDPVLRVQHHKVFDLGAFAILPDTCSMVFSQHAVSGEASRKMLLGFHGAGIILPQSKDYYPRAEFLHWHEKEVFKMPRREM